MKLNIYNYTDSLSNNKKYSIILFIDVDLKNLNFLNNKLGNVLIKNWNQLNSHYTITFCLAKKRNL